MAIEDKVKLVVVRRDSPHIEVQLGIYPSKDAALPAFKELIAKEDTLRAIIDPVEVERTAENFAAYQSPDPCPSSPSQDWTKAKNLDTRR
jgi:hypothetical protein